MKTEYVIWGIKPNEKEETLLLTTACGCKITKRENAVLLGNFLEKEKGCTKVRIQEINFNEPLDFTKTINK